MQCVMHLEKYGGLKRGEKGSVLVTGAAGGVGSVAVSILSQLGYEVVASTGRAQHLQPYLKKLGANQIIGRLEKSKPLNKEIYIGAVDCVGGSGLATALASVKYGRAVAACGLAADSKFSATVMPFILRGVKLLGIDRVQAPKEERMAVWNALEHRLPPALMEEMSVVYSLEDVVGSLGEAIISGQTAGRGIVDMALGMPKTRTAGDIIKHEECYEPIFSANAVSGAKPIFSTACSGVNRLMIKRSRSMSTRARL